MHVDNEARVEHAWRLVRRYPQDWHSVPVLAEQGADAMQRVSFVQRHTVMTAAVIKSQK